MSNQLPHNDPDLKLARKLGQLRAEGKPLDSIDDPLITRLVQYKQQHDAVAEISSTQKENIWKRILSDAESSTNSSSLKLFHSSTIRWAAAAIVLIGALFGFLYVQLWSGPSLIVESGTTIISTDLRDGSSVTLRPHSKLWSLDREPTQLLYKLQGEARFEVTPRKNRTFVVQTDKGKVSVLGTTFTLSSWGNKMQVFLEEGTVKVQALQADSAVVLSPGETAIVTQAQSIPEVQTAEIREFTDWLSNELVFNNRAAQIIIQEIEQEFNISITLPDAVKDRQLSGQLPLQTLTVALEDLELVLGGQFIKKGDQRYTFVSN